MSLINRLKFSVLALLGITLLSLAQPALAAGTLPLAMTQQHDINGQPVVCQVNFFVAGTVATPQNSYSDFGLTLNPNNQLSCDQTGRVPMFWLADGLVHVRMTDASGVPIIDTTMQVLGPSSGGGGGGGTVDPTAILQTGDLKSRYGTGVHAGWVRGNALTIGSAGSGATERANADTQNLFVYLYTVDPNLAVSGGRTGNALNDYNANKQLTLPDGRGRVPAGLDDMGNTAAARYTGATFDTGTATTLGAALHGATITKPTLPVYGLDLSGASVQVNGRINNNIASPGGTAAVDTIQIAGGGGTTGAAFPIQGTIPLGGSGTVLPTFSPSLLLTLYLKL